MLEKIKNLIKRFFFSRSLIFAMTFFLLLMIIRVIYLINWEIFLDSDESVVGIMAKHILENREFPIFYYGQSYLGTLEQFTVALFFKIFGISPIVLKVVPLIYFLLSVILLYKIANKIYQNAYYLLAFLAVPPFYYIVWSLKARGGFMEMVFLCILFLYFLFVYQKNNKPATLYLLSLIAGFSVYINTLSIPFFLSVLYLNYLDSDKTISIIKFQERAIKYFFSFIFFIFGLLPIFIFQIIYKAPYGVSFAIGFDKFIYKIKVLIFEIIPIVFGGTLKLTKPFSVFSISEIFLFILNLSAIALVLYKYRRFFIDLLFFKKQKYPKQFYILLLLPVYTAALLFSRFYLADKTSSRYLVIFILVIPVYLLEAYNILKEKFARLSNIMLFSVVLFGLIGSLQIFFFSSNKYPTNTFLDLSGLRYRELVGFLKRNNLNYGFADYWNQWNINFISGEQLIFAAFETGGYIRNRYPKYWDEVLGVSEPVYVYNSNKVEKNGVLITNFIRPDYYYSKVGDFIVFYPASKNK